jgi:hypothetical protein
LQPRATKRPAAEHTAIEAANVRMCICLDDTRLRATWSYRGVWRDPAELYGRFPYWSVPGAWAAELPPGDPNIPAAIGSVQECRVSAEGGFVVPVG